MICRVRAPTIELNNHLHPPSSFARHRGGGGKSDPTEKASGENTNHEANISVGQQHMSEAQYGS